MLKIFFSANAFSLLTFFRDVPFGRTKTLACQLKLKQGLSQIMQNSKILGNSFLYNPFWSIHYGSGQCGSLSFSKGSYPVTDLPYFKMLHKCLISADFFIRDFKAYEMKDERAIKALNSLLAYVLFSNSMEIQNNKTLFRFPIIFINFKNKS